MKNRTAILTDLLELRRPLADIFADLAELPAVHTPGEGVVLTRRHALHLLDEYLADRVSAWEAAQWALLVTSRVDIDFEDFEPLKEVAFDLAHPGITHPLDVELACDLSAMLKG